ncbi:hypothetical protein B9T25_08735 [Acinetobacter sp. ANC 4470]|uniref:AAA family ATPase n=1 Tax=Acinetobacter sp. ANC 4470 TaxID=1977881 RepID=UPI000A33ED25|nr:AAA family ATPase [Acinetobacter sp. ANC 4470]OTG66858.1 hypothetical protein B9T25_08735 [Acinetobacter sp. ANC 4470]
MKIKRIAEIQNFSIFKNFNWDSNLTYQNKQGQNEVYDFKDINIFYGRNYSGKTSLSKIIRALETKALSPKYENPDFKITLTDSLTITSANLATFTHPIHVYNSDFVKENLKFIHDDTQNIESFSVTLGGDNQQVLDHIQTLKNELGIDQENAETSIYLSIKNKTTELQTAQNNHTSRTTTLNDLLTDKATRRQDSIKNQHQIFGDIRYDKRKLTETDIPLVLQPTYQPLTEAQKQEYESLIIQRDLPEPPIPPIYDLKFLDLIKSTDLTLKTIVGGSEKIVELVSNSHLNTWVQTGLSLHHDRNTCAFCNNSISKKRNEELRQHFDEETQKLQTRITTGLKHLENQLKSSSLSINFDFNHYYENFHSELSQLSEKLKNALDKQKASIKQLMALLEDKKGKLFTELQAEYPLDYSTEILSIRDKIINIRTACIQLTNNLGIKQTNAKKELRLNYIHHFLQDINYSNLKTEIETLHLAIAPPTHELTALNTRKSEILAEIQTEENKLKTEGEACIRINNILQHDFGHQHLSLEPIDGLLSPQIQFEIQRGLDGDKVKAYNLSEGEQSLIAFCYFLAKIQDSLDQDKKPIIWIDDPICSLDSNHIFFIYTLINEKICLQGNFLQLFISTHNLDFLKYLKRLNTKVKRNNLNITLEACKYLISRTENNSHISKMPKYMSEYATEFNYLFNQIHTCATTNLISDHNFSSFYNFSNNARKFIEIYSFYKFPTYMKYDDDRLKEFWNDDIYRLFIGRINNEYSHCSGVLERGMSMMDEPEMQRAAQAIIEKVQKDTDQYNSLLESIGITAP